MLKIIKSNTRKHKASMISLFVLVSLGAMLLSIGFSVSMGLRDFYLDKIEALDSPHVSYYINTANFDEFIDDVTESNNITKWQATPTVLRTAVKYKKGSSEASHNFYFHREDESKKFNHLVVIDDTLDRPSDFIILPLIYKISFGYKSGDYIDLEMAGDTYKFKISGFFEDVYYGLPMENYFRAFMSDEKYQYFSKTADIKVTSGYLVEMQLENTDNTNEMLKYLSQTVDKVSPGSSTVGRSLEMSRYSATMSISIMAMVLIGFSFIVVIVSLIVISFSIHTAVEDGIQEIGILKASGYKNTQIIRGIVLQYTMLSLIGALLGVSLSMALLPTIGTIVASTVGLIWLLTPNVVSILTAFVTILGLVMVASFISAIKSKKVTPIMALRSETNAHNYKHNFFPFAKSKLNINVGIALKSLTQNIKQNLLILVIVAAISFAAVFSLQMYVNMVNDTTAFQYMTGFPINDVWVMSDSKSPNNMYDEIKAMSEVTNIVKYARYTINFADIDVVGLYVSDDFATVNKKTIIQGRYPIHDNEIAISSVVANSIDKNIGDTIEFSMFGKTAEYRVIGITQQMAQMGYGLDITEGGMRRLDPSYQVSGFTVDLKEDVSKEEFIRAIEVNYAKDAVRTIDIGLMLDNQLSALSMGVTATAIAIIVVMTLIVILILYMLIKMKMLMDKISIGTFKALGFTTREIILQISIYFTFVILIGATIGSVLGGFYINDIMGLLLKRMGISNANFATYPLYITYLVTGITVLSYVVSSLVALKVKKITPHSLLVD